MARHKPVTVRLLLIVQVLTIVSAVSPRSASAAAPPPRLVQAVLHGSEAISEDADGFRTALWQYDQVVFDASRVSCVPRAAMRDIKPIACCTITTSQIGAPNLGAPRKGPA